MNRLLKSRCFFEDCGRRGGRARARRLAPSQRSAIAAQAANARWKPAAPSSKPMPSVRLDQPEFSNPVYLYEVLDEGSLPHWKELYQRIADRPFGPTADALAKVLSSNKIYGITPLWKGILQSVQGVPLP